MPGQMQEGYGCVVANRFDQLLDDENDPFEALIEAAKKKDDGTVRPAKTAAQAAKPPKKEAPKDRKPVPEKKEETQAPVALKKDGMRRMGRRPEGPAGTQPQGEGRPPTERRTDRRPPRERRFERPAGEEKPAGEGGEFSVEKPAGERPFRGRGGGRGGRGGGRGRGIGRDGFDARGKREFDRHSGSDRSSLKPEEKRGGSGSHNWGTVKDELSELDQSNVTEEAPEGEEHPPADSENKENEAGEVKEEGPKEMTLDEWKAMQGKDRAKQEFNIRKPNEGADSQWKKGFVLHKSKTEAPAVIDAEAEHEVKADDEHHSRKPAHDITAQLEINFGDLGRPGRGRGGPRGGRGGRGRGGGREGGREGGRDGEAAGGAPRPARGGRTDRPSGVSVPNVDDPEAFPALA